MAHVSRRGETTGPASRGQLLLLSALGLATLLVMLALVLNTVIYTENEAVRESAAFESHDVLRTQYDAQAVASAAIDVENDGGHRSYAAMRANLTRHLETWSDLFARHAAVTGRSAAIELRSTTDGTRLVQDDTRALTNVAGLEDWTLVNDATAVRTFELTVTRSSLVDAGGNDTDAAALAGQDVFAVALADDTGTKRAFVYRDAGDVLVRVADTSGTLGPACRGVGSTVAIDFVGATVDETPCPALAGYLSLTSPTDVAFRHGASATGVYEAVVDRPAIDADVAPPGSSSDPYGERIVFEATVAFAYASPTMTYAVVTDVQGGARP